MATNVDSATLFGRAAELDQMHTHIDSVRDGRGALVLVGGEAGIGKTRLAIEVAAAADRAGLPVAWGRCPELGSAPALWPWLQALRVVADGALDELVDAEHPDGRSPGGPSGSVVSASHRYRAFRSVIDALVERAPLLIVLDDVHRADEGTLALLAQLAAPHRSLAQRHVPRRGPCR